MLNKRDMPESKTQSRWLIPLVFVFTACWTPTERSIELTDGYKPVYGSAQVKEITLKAPEVVKNPGKIYRYGKFLLVNEKQRGIHLFDNENPANPEPIGFLNIFGNTDMAIKDDVLYADHAGNIVAIRLDDFQNITVQKSLSLTNWNLGIPPPRNAYFECADPSKGIVIQWKKVVRQNLECYAF
jgi:hypothetical protein